ncbi:MAG: LacI family transcriptional regulator [Clostridiaceae bacterium]|nr:LacI family transcriptional regulator [Clostridiaceae bacterium]
MRVTINDVARAAGVSPSTVSRVLSDHPKISPNTKQRVRKAIKELNYHPNTIARSLARNTTHTIGVILNTEADLLMRNTFFIQALTGVSVYAREKGYHVMFAFNKNEDEDLAIAKSYLSGRSVDGIILFTSRIRDRCIEYLKKNRFPFSVIGRPDDAQDVLWVDNDNFHATYQVTNYLIGRGHSVIGFMGGPPSLRVSVDRYEGFKKAMSVHDLSLNKEIIHDNGDFSEEYGYDCMGKMLEVSARSGRMPDAVVTCDDMQAIGALKAMEVHGIRNISIIGFNNTPLGYFQNPRLTSVDVNADKLGYYSAKLLVDCLEKNRDAPRHYIVPTVLVERESVVYGS